MKHFFVIQILLFLSTLISCSESNEYIIETDIKNYFPDTISRLSQKEINERTNLFIEEVKRNTIGKLIPVTSIYNTDRVLMKLDEILTEETILIASDAYCGWGVGLLTSDFPNSMKKLETEIKNTRVICLAIRQESDIETPERFNEFIDELSSYYQELYIIDEVESQKLNLVFNTTRLYINKELVIKNIGIGMLADNDYLIQEIQINTNANKR
ncbi:MAG: hypothetical protein JEZ03_07870 [Bacteroidales bacterium]|nr:hypothetical protein [Bacteroidales bacterium]